MNNDNNNTYANTLDIARDCSLVRLKTKNYTGTVKDRVGSADFAASEGVGGTDRVSVYLSAIKKEDREQIQKIAGEARRWLDSKTLPWDTGVRLVPNTVRDAVVDGLRDFQKKFYAAVKANILDRYEDIRGQALADFPPHLLDRLKFPAAYEIERKYAFEIEADLVPDPSDVRLRHVSASGRSEIEASITRQNELRVRAAHEHVIGVIVKALEDIVTKLPKFEDGEIKRFEDSLLGNLLDAVEVLPALNITGDPAVSDACNRARTLVSKAKLPVLRDKKTPEAKEHRKEVVQAASGVLAALRTGAVKSSLVAAA